jgi:uncharacterized protein
MDHKPPLGPAQDRFELLDALRGFALLGILLVNMRAWAGWFTLSEAERALFAGGAENAWWYSFLIAAIFEGKFYTIFSFLFGLGFALQLSRLQSRGLHGAAIFRRRLLILLGFGLVHMSLLWDGDILALYALLGMLLPFLWHWSERRLLTAAVLLILLPIPGVALIHVVGIKPDLGLPDVGNALFVALGGDVAQEKTWLLREDVRSYLAYHLSGPAFRVGGFFETWRIPKVLAIMLIGMCAGRRLVDGLLIRDRGLLIWTAALGFAIGIPANIAYALTGGLEQDEFGPVFAATVFYAIGVVPLGLAYAASFALLWERARPVLTHFAAPGRMALTNYLSHTVFGIVIFYGIGLGFYRSTGPWVFSGLALLIFAAQIVLSRLWLTRFAQGPMEALWRRLTYGRKQAVTGSAAAV